MKIKKAILRYFLMIVAAPSIGLAWGPIGHRTIGRIGDNHLSDQANRAVAELIGPENLAQVGIWADDIRSDPDWRHADPWHYVNIEDHQTYETSRKNTKGDIIVALRRFEKTLRKPLADKKQKAEALKFLVHFVGDIHQPLHVGRYDDRGGNEIRLTWFGNPNNLHSVWDNGIIDRRKLSFSEWAEFIDHATAEQIKTWQDADMMDWAKESFDRRRQVYDIGDGNLSYKYIYSNLPLVKERLLQAGIRLAGMLNRIFAESPHH